MNRDLLERHATFLTLSALIVIFTIIICTKTIEIMRHHARNQEYLAQYKALVDHFQMLQASGIALQRKFTRGEVLSLNTHNG